MNKKHILCFVMAMFMAMIFLSCKKEVDYSKLDPSVKPFTEKMTGEPNLNFVTMHNYVIDSISAQATPFFFVVENKFDISGDNDKKLITLTVTCIDGTTVEDLDLFLSMALNYCGINAAEQDFRFKNPTTDAEGTYLDFGSVFNTYSLKIKADTQNGTILRDDYIKAGDKIPIDPRYIKE